MMWAHAEIRSHWELFPYPHHKPLDKGIMNEAIVILAQNELGKCRTLPRTSSWLIPRRCIEQSRSQCSATEYAIYLIRRA
jgi:hypothetical protein